MNNVKEVVLNYAFTGVMIEDDDDITIRREINEKVKAVYKKSLFNSEFFETLNRITSSAVGMKNFERDLELSFYEEHNQYDSRQSNLHVDVDIEIIEEDDNEK